MTVAAPIRPLTEHSATELAAALERVFGGLVPPGRR